MGRGCRENLYACLGTLVGGSSRDPSAHDRPHASPCRVGPCLPCVWREGRLAPHRVGVEDGPRVARRVEEIESTRSEESRIAHTTIGSVAERAEGIMREIRAIYSCDLHAWVGSWRVDQNKDYQNPPDETTYAAYWLAANGDGCNPSMIAVLKRRYPLRTKSHSTMGSTQFHPQPVATESCRAQRAR